METLRRAYSHSLTLLLIVISKESSTPCYLGPRSSSYLTSTLLLSCRGFTYSYLQVLLLVPLLLLPVLLSEPPLPLAPACALRCNRAVLFLARPSCMSFHMIT